jgi:hypothetical protein
MRFRFARSACLFAAALVLGTAAAPAWAQADGGSRQVIIRTTSPADAGPPSVRIVPPAPEKEETPTRVIIKRPAPPPTPVEVERPPEDDRATTAAADAGVLDAGAGVDVPLAPPQEELPPAFTATYHGQVSPLEFRATAKNRTAQERAKEATAALEGALDHNEGGRYEVTVRIESDAAIVRVDEKVVASYYEVDARLEGLPLETFAAHVGTELSSFVPTQRTRRAIQLFALHVFLSVFALVIAFVAFREIRKLFDRWDDTLDERRTELTPISLLRIPVISGEALGGALAFGLTIGRYFAYIAVVGAAFATVLSQFETTRPLLRRIGKWSAQPIVDGVDAIVSALPGLLLAGFLLLGLRGVLRVLNILLDGVARKQIVWRFLPPARVPVFRTLAPPALTLALLPLCFAAAFHQWGTPLETLALAAAGMVLVGAIPLMCSYVVGAVVLWTQGLAPGDWIQIGDHAGEVTQINLGEIRIVPGKGGTVSIPTLNLLFKPLTRLRQPPALAFTVSVERDRPATELIAAVRETVRAKEDEAEVECISINERALVLQVKASSVRSGIQETLLITLSEAAEAGAFRLLASAPLREPSAR